jgi:hypothetical protein
MNTFFMPKAVGNYYLEIGEFHKISFAIYKKPRWINRFFMRALLGIKWIDLK